MRDLVIEDSEERLVWFGAISVVGGFPRSVPDLLDVDRGVVVGFRVVGRVVARRPQQRRKSGQVGGNLSLRPHVVGRTAGGSVHARDEREPGWCADRVCQAAFEDDAPRRERIEGGRACQRVSIAGETAGRGILSHEPEDVGAITGVAHPSGQADGGKQAPDGSAANSHDTPHR